jgi:hypothetical protein
MVRIEAWETKRVLRHSAVSFFSLSLPARRCGTIRARQRISSAIKLPMPGKEFAERAFAEVARMDLGRDRSPPRRSLFAVMETDAPKLPGIAKDERAFRLAQDEVIVHAWIEACGFGAQIAAHSEVKTEPIVPGEHEEHLFPACLGAKEFLPNETAPQRARVGAAEDPLFCVQLHRENLVAEPRIPAFARIFDLGQFGHGRRLERALAPCYSWRAWKKSSSSGAAVPA